MCASKVNGGLGFRCHKTFNLAMLDKQFSTILNNLRSLLVHVLKPKYFKDNDLFSTCLGSNLSFVWRSILGSKDLVRGGSMED